MAISLREEQWAPGQKPIKDLKKSWVPRVERWWNEYGHNVKSSAYYLLIGMQKLQEASHKQVENKLEQQ